MRSPAITIMEGTKVKNQNKKKIGVGSVVKEKVGELEEITRDGKLRRTRK